MKLKTFLTPAMPWRPRRVVPQVAIGDPPGPRCRMANGKPDPSWDDPYWSAEGPTIFRQMILDHFKSLGYSTPADRDTMNALGTDAKMGGGDDVANPEVSRFQGHYNAVSRHGQFPGPMGKLLVDGFVGPCTLNALKYVVTNGGNAQSWRAAVIVANAGYA